MSNKEWTPKLPSQYENCHCVVCGEKVLAPPFVASKPRRGAGLIIAHTHCIKTMGQKEGKT